MKVSDIGEFALIDRLAELLRAPEGRRISLGVGDDASIMTPAEGMETVISSDLLIQDIHFRFSYTSHRELGRKALAVNLSDMAAMGAWPVQALVSIALPAETLVQDVLEFYRGLMDEADNCVIAGGDLSLSPDRWCISITIQGEVEAGRALRRDQASEGDLLFVSGTLGDAAAGLDILSGAASTKDAGTRRFLIQAHNRPRAEVELGRYLVSERLSTCAIDISDGLLSDLEHICRRSGVGARVELEQLPISESLLELEDNQWSDAVNVALTGGEDYRLLFTVKPELRSRLEGAPFRLHEIGVIQKGEGITLLQGGGPAGASGGRGYDHFG